MATDTIETERDARERTDTTAWAATGAGVLGALSMTSCCILPLVLVLVSLGVTGVFIDQLTALYDYKWVTFSIAAAALGYGFWKAYRPVPVEICGTGTCARPVRSRSASSPRSRGRRAAASSIRRWTSLAFSVVSRRSARRPARSPERRSESRNRSTARTMAPYRKAARVHGLVATPVNSPSITAAPVSSRRAGRRS